MGLKFIGDFLFMGVEFGQQPDFDDKNKMVPYWKVGLMQGISSRAFNIDQQDYDKLFSVAPGTPISIVTEINEYNRKTYLKLVDYQVAGLKQPEKVTDIPGSKKSA